VKKETDRKEKLTESIEESKVGREPTEERQVLMKELEEQKKISKALTAELQNYQHNDPELFQAKGICSHFKRIYIRANVIITNMICIEKAAKIAKEAANRWTENIWEMQSYCINQFGMERKLFDQQFGIKDDFDTIP
jgi:hypothetical protein